MGVSVRVSIVLMAVWLVACGDNGEPADTATDTAPDVESDSADDDTTPDDVPEDTEQETASDTAVSPDTEPDLVEDTAVEVEVEAPPAIVLNEHDCRDEWVELVNTGDTPIDLEGLVLTDDPEGDNRLPLTGTLAAGSRLAVALTTFSLACGDEAPALLWRGQVLADSPPGNAPDGHTFGRFPDTTGEWVVTAPTRGEPNKLPDIDPFDPAASLFGPLRPIATVELTLPQSTIDSLWQSPYTWVPGTFAFREAAGDVSAPQTVALRIKGRIGSYRDLNGKTAFKLDFARFSPNGEFRGLEEMTLNNMVQDYNHVNEVLAYDLFARMGVPTPRQTYVWLKINGEDYGLYLHLEAYDRRWRDRHFDSTLGMFEGAYGSDLFSGTAFAFDLDGGDDLAYLALDALVQAVNSAPREGFMAALDPLIDWDEVLSMMATEIFIGHWDGYGPTRNNFFLHFDGEGVLRMVPWGLDQTFGADLGFFEGQGLLLQGCVADPSCRMAFQDKLERLVDIVRSPGYLGWANGLDTHLQTLIDAEPREDAGEAKAGLDNAWSFLERRAEAIDTTLACWRDPLADVDGDSHICDNDCAEGDPDRYVGATEVCDDGIDQDCSGRVDDGPDCPDCVAVAIDGFGTYRICWRERTFADAAAECERLGMRLIQPMTPEEQIAMLVAIDQWGIGSAWVGITDRQEEGVWRWLDGRVWDGSVGGWLDGQPDDWMTGEDCVQALTWGGERPWNDLACDWTQPAVCQPL